MSLLLSTIFLPFLVAILIALIGERNNYLRNGLLMGISIFDFAVVLYYSEPILAGQLAPYVLADLDFFQLAFHVDALSLLMGSVITFLWIFTSSFSIGYMAGEHSQPRYFTSLTVCLGATLGIVFAANLMSFFIFYEMQEALRAGVVYLVYLLSGGTLVFFAIILTYFLTGGNLTFTMGGIPQLAAQKPVILYLLFFLFVTGLGVKSALVPLHIWLPRAMIAPTPVSALLHAVAVVNVGLYGFIRMIYNVFGPALFERLNMDTYLAIPASITIVMAAVAALRVNKIKKLLAYSTINQLSYVILGASSLHAMALMGALIHVVYHSVMKITLFYSAGTIMKKTGKTMIQEMSGLAKVMPVTCAAFAIGALGISGLPPIAGWISKWYLIEGFLDIGRPWHASIFIISTIIEIGFLSPPILYAYFGTRYTNQEQQQEGLFKFEAPLDMLIPVAVVAVLSVTFGLFGSLPFVFGSASIKALIP
jgi:multicomponent Na+:H+ antiporter subunit D